MTVKYLLLVDSNGRIKQAAMASGFQNQSLEGVEVSHEIYAKLQVGLNDFYWDGAGLVPIPTKPSIHHVFDWTIKQWFDPRTAESEWAVVRRERDRRLAACDWVVARASEAGQPVPAEWVSYRQALRDITTQVDPFNIVWPVSPEQVVVA